MTTQKPSQLQMQDPKLSYLSEKEQKALAAYELSGSPPLAAKTSLELFQLYLQGYSIADVAKAYPSLGLGVIVQSCVANGWFELRNDYMANLTRQTSQAIMLTQMESIRFSTDAIAVFHKLMGNKFQKYLSSGKEEDLGEFAKMSVKDYKGFIALFQQLTGQGPDGPKKIAHTLEVLDAPPAPQPVNVIDVTPTSILDLLEKDNK